jgi:hypothetical protein
LKESEVILDFFYKLNNEKIQYVLLHNIGDELPYNFKFGKDIDILVRDIDRNRFKKLLKQNYWKRIKHSHDYIDEKNIDHFIFLYNMFPFEMYKNKISKMIIDVCYQLNCKSINNGEWMPLDQKINDSVWSTRKFNNKFHWYELNVEDQLIHLIIRSIFYKKNFSNEYIEEINGLLKNVNIIKLEHKLDLIFFRFSSNLLNMIKEKNFHEIIDNYHRFSNY